MRHFLLNSTVIALLLGLFSCDGILDDIYDDEVPAMTEEAFTENTVSVDASSYQQWVYIDFHNKKVETVAIVDGESPVAEEPENWDIALHRFQVKTNGGSAIETSFSTISEFSANPHLPKEGWKEDTWYEESVITDLSGMMSGQIKYTPSYLNDVVCGWITSSGMPPEYTTSDKVYVIRLSDNTCLAIRLDSYMDNNGTKGFLKLSYSYPVRNE
ncbi:MAG: HmuY family protein [Paludibacteraceae bacterium]|nr:HmuY family protein [Paludibacteraceae bacterium]